MDKRNDHFVPLVHRSGKNTKKTYRIDTDLDIEAIDSITSSDVGPSAFYSLDVNRNIDIIRLTVTNYKELTLTDQSEFLSQVSKINKKHEKTNKGLDLLGRGRLISVLTPRVTETRKFPLPTSQQILRLASSGIKESLDQIDSERSEEMETATSDAEKSVEPIPSPESSDEEEILPEVPSLEPLERPPLVTELDKTIIESDDQTLHFESLTKKSPSNREIQRLYSTDPEPSKKPSHQVQFIESSVPQLVPFIRKPIKERISDKGKRKVVIEPVPGPSHLSQTTPAPVEPEKPKRDAVMTGLNILIDRQLETDKFQDTIIALVQSLTDKIVDVETQLISCKSSIDVVTGKIATIDANIGLLLNKRTAEVVSKMPLGQEESPATSLKAQQFDLSKLTEDEMAVALSAQEIYDNILAKFKFQYLTRDVFVHINLIGGMVDYFEKMHPGKKAVDTHLFKIDTGTATTSNFQAVDRYLGLLTTKPHKESYLEKPGERPMYRGQSAPAGAYVPPFPEDQKRDPITASKFFGPAKR